DGQIVAEDADAARRGAGPLGDRVHAGRAVADRVEHLQIHRGFDRGCFLVRSGGVDEQLRSRSLVGHRKGILYFFTSLTSNTFGQSLPVMNRRSCSASYAMPLRTPPAAATIC